MYMSNVYKMDILENKQREYTKRSNIWGNSGQGFSRRDENHELSDLRITIHPRLVSKKNPQLDTTVKLKDTTEMTLTTE